MEIPVQTVDGKKIIVGNKDTLQEIRTELQSMKSSVSEYITTNGEIITDLDIERLLSTKK